MIWIVFAGLSGGVMAAADMLRERKMESVATQATPRRDRGIACGGSKDRPDFQRE